MKRGILGALLLTCALAFALVGCAGNSTTAPTKENLVGLWVLDDAASMGFDAYVDIEEEDSLAMLIVGDSVYEGTWKIDGANSAITIPGETQQTVKIGMSGDKLVIGGPEGSKLVFKKGSYDDLFGAPDGAVQGEDGSQSGEAEQTVQEVINDIPPVVVADDATCTITVTGKGTDYTADPGYRMTITNKTNKAIYVTAEDLFTASGKQVEAGLGDTVEAGETLETFMFFDKEEIGGGAEALTGVSGTINVEDDEEYNEIANYAFHMD